MNDVELEEEVAGGQRHLLDLAHVPGQDEQAAGVGVAPDLFDDLADLVNRPPVGRLPPAPLLPVDGPQVAFLVRPLVPDAYPVLFQVLDVRVAAQKPQQLVDDRAQVNLLGRDDRQPVFEVEAHLVAEGADGAGSGAVLFGGPVAEDVIQEV